MDRKLLDILVCPTTRLPPSLLEKPGLDAPNGALAAGGVSRADGSAQAEPVREALVSRDRQRIYRLEDGIPVLLADEAIATNQLQDFPEP